MKAKVLVLGAGLTGLSFVHHLDNEITIYEREQKIGGLVRTIIKDEYHFDLAPHLLHLRSEYVKELLFKKLGLKANNIKRKSKIFFKNKLIPYPFELNLFHLSKNIKEECLHGVNNITFVSRNDMNSLKRGSYSEYAYGAFGKGIAEHYLLPYNYKIWDTDPRDMTCEWMRFLPTADVEKIMMYAYEPSTEDFGYNVHFYYPKNNGIQELSNCLAFNIKNILLEKSVTSIDIDTRIATFNSGERIQYDFLISTIPLRDLLLLTNNTYFTKLSKELVSTKVYSINIVAVADCPSDAHWIYFPEEKYDFYRISLPKNYYPDSAPYNHNIFSIEISSRSNNKTININYESIKNQLKSLSIFNIKEVLNTYTYEIKVAYCIYDFNRTKIVNEALSQLEKYFIYSTGRFGKWEYSAMEDAILYGKELAEKIKSKL